jgi:ribosomal protein L24
MQNSNLYKMNDDIENKEQVYSRRWCILRHPDADLIGDIFSGKRKVYNTSDDNTYPLPPFEHFIPFEDMKLKPIEMMKAADDEFKSYDAMLDARALRTDLHHFIFICQPKEVVSQILNSPWNKALRNRLYAYRNENGEPIEISDTEMERFKTVIKRFDFQIVNGMPSGDVHEGDAVAIIDGPMTGSEGVITGIREKDGQVLLTVTFSMFQDKMRIAVPGISIANVQLKTQEAQQLLQDPVISHFEDELIELLCHLHGKKGSKALNKSDHRRLKYLYQYSDIVFEDNEVNRAKFQSLMLICVYLMNDKEETERRAKEVESLISCPLSSLLSPLSSKQEPPFSSELDCYLIIALFIITHNPALRKQVKLWRKSHPDCSLVIRRLFSIAKQIRC